MLRLSLYGLVLCLFTAPVQAHRDLIKTTKIRQKCEEFDRQRGSATRRSSLIFGTAQRGSTLTALDIKGQTRKLHFIFLSTMGSLQETIYLENRHPIWVTQIQTTYEAPASRQVVKRSEEWLYFENGKLIQRDFMPVTIVKGISQGREGWIHQTVIRSPAQGREWKAKAIEWQQKVNSYQRALKTKP